MKEELTVYYKNEISLSGMVYKHMKLQARLINVTAIISIIALLVIPFISQFKYFGWVIVGAYIWFFLTILSFYFFTESAKKIVTTKHNIEVKSNIWNNTAFQNKQELLLKRYLISNGLFTKRKIELLHSLLKDDVNKTRLIPPIIQTILVSVIVTGITKSFTTVFKIDVSNLETIIIIFVATLVLLIVMMSIVINIIENYKHYFFRKIYYKKPLLSQLEDILLKCFD